MTDMDMLKQLKTLSVEKRPFACQGCTFEHGCTTKGCAVINKAIDRINYLNQVKSDLIKMGKYDMLTVDLVLDILDGGRTDER